MGYEYKFDPFRILDPRDPSDVAEFVVEHAIEAFSVSMAVRAYTGAWPGPGHVSTVARALFSPSMMGSGAASNVARQSALSSTRFALGVYASPFLRAARFLGPVGTAVWLGYELYHAPAVDMNIQQRTRFDKVQAQRAADRERYG